MLTCLQISKWSQHFIAELRLKTIQYFMDQMTSLENTEVRQSSASLRVWVTNTVLFSGDAIFWADIYICIFVLDMQLFGQLWSFLLKVMPSMAGLQTIFQVNGRIETENCYGATKSNIFLTQYSLVNQTNNIFSYMFLLRMWGSTKTSPRIFLHCTSVCCQYHVEMFRFVFSNQIKRCF